MGIHRKVLVPEAPPRAVPNREAAGAVVVLDVATLEVLGFTLWRGMSALRWLPTNQGRLSRSRACMRRAFKSSPRRAAPASRRPTRRAANRQPLPRRPARAAPRPGARLDYEVFYDPVEPGADVAHAAGGVAEGDAREVLGGERRRVAVPGVPGPAGGHSGRGTAQKGGRHAQQAGLKQAQTATDDACGKVTCALPPPPEPHSPRTTRPRSVPRCSRSK